MSRPRLGKGLEALIPKEKFVEEQRGVTEIPLEKIQPNPGQPRKDFDQEKLIALADTISEYGVIQPVIVKQEADKYILVAGERRFRAAQIAGLKTIPAVIKEYDVNQLMEVTLVENIQRENLNPIEEAAAYKKLIEEFGLRQEELAKKIGKSRSAITNSIRLLSLDQEVKAQIANGTLTVGQARPLLTLESQDEQKELAQKIIRKKLSARKVEELVKTFKEKKEELASKGNVSAKDGQGQGDSEQFKALLVKDYEENIRKAYGTKVKIKSQGGQGKVELYFYGDDDLERLLNLLLKDGER